MSTLRRRNNKKEVKRIEKELKALGVVPYYTDVDDDANFDAKVKELLKKVDFNSINDDIKQLHEITINKTRLAGLDIDYDIIISIPSPIYTK